MNTADQSFLANMASLHSQLQACCQDCMDNGEDCTDMAGSMMNQSQQAMSQVMQAGQESNATDVMNAVIRGSYTPWQ